MNERGKLHGKEPGSQVETKREGSELITLSFEEHSEKSPGFGVNGDVEVCILQINAVCPHFRKKGSLMDSADSILKCLGLRNWLNAFRSMMGQTTPDFLGTIRILLKNPGPAPAGTGSRALFLRRASNCSWRVSIFFGSREVVTTGPRHERRGGLSNSRW